MSDSRGGGMERKKSGLWVYNGLVDTEPGKVGFGVSALKIKEEKGKWVHVLV